MVMWLEHSRPWSTMVDHGDDGHIRNLTMVDRGQPWSTTVTHKSDHGRSWSTAFDHGHMQLDRGHHHGIWRSTMNYHGRPSNTVVTMVDHGRSRTSFRLGCSKIITQSHKHCSRLLHRVTSTVQDYYTESQTLFQDYYTESQPLFQDYYTESQPLFKIITQSHKHCSRSLHRVANTVQDHYTESQTLFKIITQSHKHCSRLLHRVTNTLQDHYRVTNTVQDHYTESQTLLKIVT